MRITQTETSDSGLLQVFVTSAENSHPINDALVSISSMDGDHTDIVEELNTNSSGQTQQVSLPAPPLDYSLQPNEPRPYAVYRLTITAPGYEPLTIEGSEILPAITALQDARLIPIRDNEPSNPIAIPDHTLYGEYPPKIAEDEVKPVRSSGEVVLSRVVVPETIIVHDGAPSSNATNFFVPYRDYIKNVASSEIYSTWPKEAIVANVLAIQSFTLNRIYTEWYRNQGFDFNVTSSTAHDQKWMNGRNIFQPISEVVDEIFDSYLSRPNIKQPILTQYCDGNRVQCPNWMSQWGSKDLAENGMDAAEIIRYFYGDDMYINNAEQIAGIPSSWPGYNLSIGSSGEKVKQLQEQLLTISDVYSAIPTLTPTGYFDEATAAAVTAFQNIFGLGQTGIVDFPTWYKISQIYVGVTRIGEYQ